MNSSISLSTKLETIIIFFLKEIYFLNKLIINSWMRFLLGFPENYMGIANFELSLFVDKDSSEVRMEDSLIDECHKNLFHLFL